MATQTDEPPLLLSVPEAGRLIGVGRARAYELVNNGVLPSLRYGRRCIRVPRKALEGWIEANTEPGRNLEAGDGTSPRR